MSKRKNALKKIQCQKYFIWSCIQSELFLSKDTFEQNFIKFSILENENPKTFPYFEKIIKLKKTNILDMIHFGIEQYLR